MARTKGLNVTTPLVENETFDSRSNNSKSPKYLNLHKPTVYLAYPLTN